MAISALMFVFAFNILDKLTREILSAFAALVIVIFSGIHSRNTWPGCGGLCMLLIILSFSGSLDNPPTQRLH